MSLVLVLTLSVTLGTGLALHGVHGAGPLAGVMNAHSSAGLDAATANGHEHGHEDEEDAAEEFWEELHELFVNISLALVMLHVLGVLASSWRHGENLPKSMLNGRKKRLPE